MLRTILKKITTMEARNTEAEAICHDLACLDMDSVTDLHVLIKRAEKI